MRPLIPLARKYCCDKFYAHSYIPFYEELFEGREVKRLLEIGIGYEELMLPFVPEYIHGASLKMWEEYFPGAKIFGCDNRLDTLVNTDRISSYLCDQSNRLDLERLVEDTGGRFDVVIDDGSHSSPDQILSAEILVPHVRKGGVYIIEDVQDPDLVAEAVKGKTWRPEIVGWPGRPDDTLVVIER